MPNALQLGGSQSKRQSRFVPIFTNRFFQGLWTQRNPLRDAGSTRLEEKFYGARGDALIDGLNVEISNKLTLQRRPGCSVYNNQTFPAINSFYEFRTFQSNSSTITILADTGQGGGIIYDCTGPSRITPIIVKNSNAGNAYFQSVGNVLYFGDGAETEKYYSYNGNPVLQKWGMSNVGVPSGIFPSPVPGLQNASYIGKANIFQGIDVPFNGTLNQIPAIPPTPASLGGNATVSTVYSSTLTAGPIGPPASFFWTNATNFGSQLAVGSHSGIGGTFAFYGTGYNLNVPSDAVVTGIQVSFTRSLIGIINASTDNIQLLYGGTGLTIRTVNNGWAQGQVVETYGGNTDLWGSTWTPAKVNDASFGFAVGTTINNLSPTNNPYTVGAGKFILTVFYTLPGTPTQAWGLNHWTNPADIASSVNYAEIVTASYTQYDSLAVPGFGFGIPEAASVTGVAVTFNHFVTPTQSGAIDPVIVTLYSNSGIIGTQTLTDTSSVSTPTFVGGATNLWGAGSISSSQINNSLAVSLTPVASQEVATATHFFNELAILIYTTSPPVVTIAGNGSITASIGYSYVYSYINSQTGHFSSASAPSNSTGPVSNGAIGITLIPSSDPQVTGIALFRTVDGGSTYFLLPDTYSNQAYTVYDNFPDSYLAGQPLAPIADNNDPPPSQLINLTYHNGSVWGSVGNTAYFSRLPDSTVGVPSESFPPLNYFIFPSYITRMVTSSVGLAIFTTSDMYLITGSGTSSNPYQASLFLTRLGLLSYNALTVNGTIIYMFTSDSQFVSLDPNAGVTEIGFPIGDLLDGTNTTATIQPDFNPNTAYVTWHVKGSGDKAIYICDGATGWFRVNTTAAPESGLTWSPFAQITLGCKSVQSIEVAPGDYELLIGPGNLTGPILKRDSTVFSDNGVNYPAFATIGSIVLANPGQMAELAYISCDSQAVGSKPVISVLLDEISGQPQPLSNFVNEPPALLPSQSLYSNRYYFSQNNNLTAWCRHLQIQLTWPTEGYKNELLSYTLVGAHWAEN